MHNIFKKASTYYTFVFPYCNIEKIQKHDSSLNLIIVIKAETEASN